MNNSFVTFLRETDAVSIKDYTRDGYKTVFVRVIEEHIFDELEKQAEDAGYEDYGVFENLDTQERVRMFSQDESRTQEERYGIYVPVDSE